jgi:hypothetical protein
LKPDRSIDEGGNGSRFGASRRFAASGGGGAWCGCRGAPTRGTLVAPIKIQEHRVDASAKAPRTLDDLDQITLQFHKPVEEPFDVTSPTLKTP